MSKHKGGLNIAPHLGSPSSNGGGGSTTSASGGGYGGGGSGVVQTVLPDYLWSSSERYAHLPPDQMAARMATEDTMQTNRAHLDIEKNRVRLQRLTQLPAFVQAYLLYYEQGGTQSLVSAIDPKAVMDIDTKMEGRTGLPHKFATLTEKAKVALLKELLKAQQSTSASFAAAVKGIAQTRKFFNMNSHENYLGDHKELTCVGHEKVWQGMSKDAQLRSVVSGLSPASFKDAVSEALRQTAHADYWAGMVIIAAEAAAEEIRENRNEAARKLQHQTLSRPQEASLTPKASPKAPPAAIDESDDDTEPSSRISANLTAKQPYCPNCSAAGRHGKAIHHSTTECEWKCCHGSCASKRPHLAAECVQWLPSSMRDKSPPSRREGQSRRERRDHDYDEERFDKAQEARLAVANRNARKANLARSAAAAYASDSDENATYDDDDPEVAAARLYAHSIAVRGNSARIREEPSRATAEHDLDVPADSLYWHTVRGNSARTREEPSRAKAEYEIDRAHRADLAARFGYTPPSSDYDSEADGAGAY